jgi:hypothetical protein
LETTRLNLKEVTVADSKFILELVNTHSWIRFIGNRKVRSEEEAKVFIQKINDNSNLTYWVISRKSDSQPVGIISFAKRDFLNITTSGLLFCLNMSTWALPMRRPVMRCKLSREKEYTNGFWRLQNPTIRSQFNCWKNSGYDLRKKL